jgi:hypothetical protein
MRRAAFPLALACCLALAACAPDRPASTSTSTSAAGPRDDYELIVSRFGSPDADDSTDHDTPRPPIPSRLITYKKEHVRFIFIPSGKLGDAPPYLWKLVGPSDPRTQKPLAPAKAVARLAARDRKPAGK